MSLERERLLGNLLDRLDALEAKLAELAGSAITLQVVGDRAAPGDGFLSGWRATGTTLQSPEGEIVLDSSIPAVQVMDETGSERARLGRLDGITDPVFGALSGFGLWTDAVYLTGGINATEGQITGLLDMGDGGEIRVGTGTPGTDFTGLRLYRSGTTYRLEGQNAGALQAYFDSDGTLKAGEVTLSGDGLTIAAGYDETQTQRAVRWISDLGHVMARVLGWEGDADPYQPHLTIEVPSPPSAVTEPSVLHLEADRIYAGLLTVSADPVGDTASPSGLLIEPTRVRSTLPLAVSGAITAITLTATGLVKGGDVEAVDELRGARATLTGDVNAGGDVGYDGDLKPVRGGTTYTGYPVIPEPSGGVTDAAWDGDAKAAGDYTIDTSAWGLPAGVKGVWVRLTARWSATASSSIAGLRRDSSSQIAVVARAAVGGIPDDKSGFVPCDSNGDFEVHITADADYVKIVITGYVL